MTWFIRESIDFVTVPVLHSHSEAAVPVCFEVKQCPGTLALDPGIHTRNLPISNECAFPVTEINV